jgi:hypothetical protein
MRPRLARSPRPSPADAAQSVDPLAPVLGGIVKYLRQLPNIDKRSSLSGKSDAWKPAFFFAYSTPAQAAGVSEAPQRNAVVVEPSSRRVLEFVPRTAAAAALADARALIKNPAHDTGSRPALAGQTYEPPVQHLAAFSCEQNASF